MRSSLILKSVLFCVLFNGAAIATAQAAHLAREINRIGNTCEAHGPKVGMTAADQGSPFHRCECSGRDSWGR